MIEIATFAQFVHQVFDKFTLPAVHYKFEQVAVWLKALDRLSEHSLNAAPVLTGKIAQETRIFDKIKTPCADYAQQLSEKPIVALDIQPDKQLG